MRVIEFDNPLSFRDRTLDFLLKAEAERCIELGIIDRLLAGSTTSMGGEPLAHPRLWVVERDGDVKAVAVQTIRDRMIVSRGSRVAMEALAAHMAGSEWDGRFLIGVVPSIRDLAPRFASLTSRCAHRAMGLRTMQLTQVIPPQPTSGALRQCGPADADLLARWTVAFCREVGEPDDDGVRMATSLLKDRRAFLWENGDPVAMAAWAGPTPNGIRINFVYTPPEHRRRGYASNLVAALSARLLAESRRFCFLFTDQANPISNHVYESIGYNCVCENERWDISLVP